VKIGIDIGSYSIKTARLTPEGIATIVPDAQTRLAYTLTSFRPTEGGFLVGADASTLSHHPTDILEYLKKTTPVLTDHQKKSWYAAGIVALYIKKIRLDTDVLHIEGAVSCVPSSWDSVQKKGMETAVQLADIPLLRCVDAPIAAAWHHRPSAQKPVLIIDWGHSGLRLSLVQKTSDTFQSIASIEKQGIGGKHWNDLITEWLLQQFKVRFDHLANSHITQAIASCAGALKENLSDALFAKQTILAESELLGIMLDRQSFERLISADMPQFSNLLNQLLRQVSLSAEGLDEVILTGGCTLVPYVKQKIKAHLTNVKKWYDKDALLANALGSVRYAVQFIPGHTLPETDHLNLGVLNINSKTQNTEIDTIVARTSALPARTRRTYYTATQDQREINLTIVQFGEDKSDYDVLDKVLIGPLLSSEAHQAIEVTFVYDEEGILRITGYDPETGTEYQNTLQITASEGFQFYPQRRLVRSTPVNGVI